MISLSIIIIVVLSIILAVLMDKNGKMIVGQMLSYVAILFCISVYIIKIGGLSGDNLRLLFVFDTVTNYLKNLPISLSALSFAISIFRCLFVLFMIYGSLLTCLMAKQFLKKRKWLYFLIALPFVLILTVSHPEIYATLLKNNIALQNFVSYFIYFIIYGYILCGMFLYYKEFCEIKLSWYKKRLVSLGVMVAILCLSFCILAGFNPFLIISDSVNSIKIVSLFRISLRGIQNTWYIIFASSVCATIAISVQTVLFLKIEYDSENVEVLIKNKMANASISSTVMIHGMKNQILSTVFLCNQIVDTLKTDDCEKNNEIIDLTKRIKQINLRLLDKMTKTYLALKEVNIILKPIQISEIIDEVKNKVKEKGCNVDIQYRIEEGMIVADIELLSEAVYNILINAIEASKEVEKPTVICETMFRRTSSIIKIIDNGVGIDKKLGNKIFMPFTTNKNTNENWGLGLSYAMNIVKKHMGNIVYETAKGEGTEFAITLPKYNGR